MPNLTLSVIILVVLVLKWTVVSLLQYYGKKFKSELMIEASKESKADFISTCVVLIVLILSFLEEYIPNYINIDKIGSLGMAIYVFYTAIKMIISNIRGILTNDEANDELKEDIVNELKAFKTFQIKKAKIIKMSNYYSVFLQVRADENLTIKEYLTIEKR